MDNIQDIIERMKELQQKVVDYIDYEGDEEEDYEGNSFDDLISYFEEIEIKEVQKGFVEFIQFLVTISNNHHRLPGFFAKIQQILLYFKDQIQQTFSNSRLFKIFSSSKPLLLFLIKEKLLVPDQNLATQLLNDKMFKISKYYQYFYPEFNSFYDQKTKNELKSEYENLISDGFDSFDEKREAGENEKRICSMIRDDLADEFITYMTENNVPRNATIDSTVFESNSFLINKTPSLFEYSAFYGAIQIFKYLDLSKVQLTSSLWLYAIHGKNGELIHYLEENHLKPKDKDYIECLQEAIKCHHNSIAEYVENNLLDLYIDKKEFAEKMKDYGLKCLNYFYMPENFTDESVFYDLCKYNYSQIVYILLKTTNININCKIKILPFNFFNRISIENVLI